MTLDEQKDYWLKFHRTQKRYEDLYKVKFNNALKEQVQQYIDNGSTLAINSTPIYKTLLDLYTTVGPQWAQYATVDIRRIKARRPVGFSERIVELMRAYYGIDLLNDAQGITETTIRTINEVLSDAAESGISFDEIVIKLQSPELTAARARLIARTETVTSSNSASEIAAKETGIILDKIWIPAHDLRTRIGHALMNNVTISIDDKFTVPIYKDKMLIGTESMSHPGDIKASAANRCSCRCTEAFIPKRDKNGRVLRH